MACQRQPARLVKLTRSFSIFPTSDPLLQCLAPRLTRPMATATALPPSHPYVAARTSIPPPTIAASSPTTPVLTTLYSWPSLRPQAFAYYHPSLLSLPLRRDILHRAVIFEADATRAGNASTKHRTQVHGSGRKIRPQKGTGQARLGDKKSPMLRGGGVAFGPHPRDFSTELPRKIYDKAWRTALSHRYRKAELVVLSDIISLHEGTSGRFLNNVFEAHSWGRAHGRSLLVTSKIDNPLYEAMAQVGEQGLIKDIFDVDVKDLLETGRVVIEKRALDVLLYAHSRDLGVKGRLTISDKAPLNEFLEHAEHWGMRQRRMEMERLREQLARRVAEGGHGSVGQAEMTAQMQRLEEEVEGEGLHLEELREESPVEEGLEQEPLQEEGQREDFPVRRA